MQISVEATGNLERRMTIAVPADRLEKAFAERITRLSKNVKMPGFRPGKVPLKMVEAQYGGQVMQEVAGDLIQASFQEAVGKEGLKPAGGPQIEPKSLARGKDLEYTATFEVYPEIKQLDIAGVRIERPVSEVTDADIDSTLENMRRQRMIWQPVERAAANGDRLVIDFVGTLDGEPFAGGTASDFEMVLGQGNLLKEFEDALAGAKPAESRGFDVPFPADYQSKELAGKTGRFEVTVKRVEEPVLPQVDEEFAKGFGVADGSVDKLRAEVKENLERELGERIRVMVRDRVMQALLDANEIDVPKPLVDGEIEHLQELNRETLRRHGASPDLAPTDREAYEDNARRRVALGLILSEVAQANKLNPEPERVRKVLERMASAYENPEEFVNWHFEDPRRLGDAQAVAIEDMIVERLLEGADVVDVKVPFGELMYPDKKADKTDKS
jgi:trigger factor